jgi:hypothetical protein
VVYKVFSAVFLHSSIHLIELVENIKDSFSTAVVSEQYSNFLLVYWLSSHVQKNAQPANMPDSLRNLVLRKGIHTNIF